MVRLIGAILPRYLSEILIQMKTSILYISLLYIICSTSCKKSGGEVNPSLSSAQNNAFAEAQFNDVSIMVDQAIRLGNIVGMAGANSGGSGVNGPWGSPCVAITLDTISSLKNVVIDFGTANCLCIDGRYRRGKVVAQFEGGYLMEGTVINISFQEYFVNDHRVMGLKTVTNMGLNYLSNPVYKVEVMGSVEKPVGGSYTWNSIKYREWKEGYNTPLYPLDDVFVISGSSNGTNTDGTEYTITITKPLVKRISCRWFEGGALELLQPGVPRISLDYGNTGCDENATISVRGVSYPVRLE